MFNDYILVLGKQSEDIQALESLLGRLRCSVAVAACADQAVAQASQTLPYLVILSGDRQDWPPNLVKQLRQMARVCGSLIVPHDGPWGGQDVAATTAQLIPQLWGKGYQFVTVEWLRPQRSAIGSGS